MKHLDIILVFLIIIGCFVAFGPALKVTTTGGPGSGSIATEQPNGIGGLASWLWNGLSFLFEILTFQIPDAGVWISTALWIGFIIIGWIIVNLVRGPSGGV